MAGGTVAAAGPYAAAAAPGSIKLRLLETSDIHTFDADYDYFRDTEDATVGLTKIATLIHAARAESPNTLLFDNGDIIQGNPLADYVAIAGNYPADHTHPTIRAMNLLGYDAATIGNHEFNYGLPFFNAALAGAKFPFCCANLQDLDGKPYLAPYLILDRPCIDSNGGKQMLKIGIIGFVTPQIMEWDKAHLAGKVQTIDIVDAANHYIPILRPQVDVLIVLCHSGISAALRRGGEENAAFYLADVPGIDVIFTGHSHRVLPGPDYAGIDGVDAVLGRLKNIPAVMPGFWGSHLGIIDLTLSQSGAAWAVTAASCGVRPIAQRDGGTVTSLAADDAAVNTTIAPEHAKTLAWIRQPIGELAHPVTSYFAFIGNDSSLALVNAAQIWYAKPLLAGDAARLPLLAAAAPFKEGYQSPDNFVSLAAGTIAIRDVADLYMYPNTVCVLAVTGAQLREWLEHSAEVFAKIDPDDPTPQMLLNPHVPSYVFDVIAGITYQIDITQPARYGAHGKFHPQARRITNLAYQGVAVSDEQNFAVVTNNYRADAGGIIPAGDDDAVVLRAPDQTRDVIIRYILQQKRIDVPAPPVWSFVPFGSPVTLVFNSAPEAAKFFSGLPNITRLADTADGYAQYAMTLS